MLDQQYIDGLTQMSVLIIIISIVVVSALGALFSNMLLSPVRKMIKKIDMISADDLSTRLDTVDGTTEIRELTERINKMLDNIEESFISQKKFVSDASHELKTPISVIQGYSNLLQRWGKKNEVILEEGIDSISREANNMKRIVEQLLFLAKSGSFVMICEELDLKKELTKIAEGYALLHSTREIRLSAQSNIRLKLDRNMLTECVRAIVDNAIKYSPDGTDIDITLRKTENAVRISIADRGNGIDEKDIPYIFDRFYRCDKSRHRDDSSSGLGLTIVQTIVDKMNGKIEVKSKVGVGTTFTLVFPTKEIENGKENRITM